MPDLECHCPTIEDTCGTLSLNVCGYSEDGRVCVYRGVEPRRCPCGKPSPLGKRYCSTWCAMREAGTDA